MIRFFNTLTKKKEIFKPLGRKVTMYNCGLTVYDYAHIGNLRAYAFVDLLRRWLEWKGYKVKQVMNFTDVGHMTQDEVLASDVGEDKMETAARREHKIVWDIADFYIKAFLEDSKKMNFLEPYVRPQATKHIKEMLEIIKLLIERGYAYETPSGVYFDVSRFKNYGKLSGNTIERLKEGAGGRVEFNPHKRNQFDFALWINDPNHLMKWNSPYGTGYPGWHIECSAMSMKYLGKTLDIHTGGVDNIFPHHECEIAQSEGATGKPFVRYWMHTSHLLVNGQKMAKSLGNFFTLRDLLEKGYNPKAIRFLLLSAHYRTQLNFTEDGLRKAEKTLTGMIEFLKRLKEAKGKDNKPLSKKIIQAKRKFESALDDDLNMPLALAAVFDFIRETNKAMDENKLSKKNAKEIISAFLDMDKVLGLGLKEQLKKKQAVPKYILELLKKREQLRRQRRFEEADRIRKEILEQGYIIEDTPKGPKAKKKII